MSTSAKSPGPDTGLAADLRQRIRNRGAIGFDEFMAAALYDPWDGYYAASTTRVGKHGDFFTSVSVGPVFGRLLAAQFAAMWEQLGCPDDFTLVEQGAADGQLMADILRALDEEHPGVRPRAMVIEPLSILRTAQERTLHPWRERLTHISREDLLPPFTGVFFANELLDAFPVRLFVKDGTQWLERRVTLDGDRLVFTDETVQSGTVPPAVRALPLPPDARSFQVEFRPDLERWMRTVAPKLQQGWLLLMDYGHAESARCEPHRAGGTLAAYSNHRRLDDPLASPGGADLTAHVNFTAVARAGMDSGLVLAGYTDQHHALAALAAQVFPGMRSAALSPEEAREMRALRQLLHPEGMGIAFKFLALARGTDTTPAAFAMAGDAHKALFS